jgi:Ca2+-binding EF-hand superfamily protein
MKTSILAAAAFAGLAAAPLFAQPAPTPPSTRAEMETSIQQRFAARDANHDGFLTADELGESGPAAVARLDTDHDGKISLAEARTAMMAMFDRADTNHDGVVSPEERAAAMAQMQSQGQPAAQPAPAATPQPH